MTGPIRSWRVRCMLGVLKALSSILILLLFMRVQERSRQIHRLAKLNDAISDIESEIQFCNLMIRDSTKDVEFYRSMAADYEAANRLVNDAINASDPERFERPLPVMCKISWNQRSMQESRAEIAG